MKRLIMTKDNENRQVIGLIDHRGVGLEPINTIIPLEPLSDYDKKAMQLAREKRARKALKRNK